MYPLETNPTAIQIIARSMTCHPTTFADMIRNRMKEDYAYSASREGMAKQAAKASGDAARIALGIVESGDTADLFAGPAFMGPGIIALNIACKLQCLPPHIRTAAAVATWGDN